LIIVVTGVSGSGKSTLGQALARTLHWEFVEGDDYHPRPNIEKMRAGLPLGDDDRKTWLARLHNVMTSMESQGRSAAVACSALKKTYRDVLAKDLENIRFVFLYGDMELLRERLAARQHPFMPPGLLDSQFAALEPPTDALLVPVRLSTKAQASLIRHRIGVEEPR
jgi:gluconokinase